jgi:internalin A
MSYEEAVRKIEQAKIENATVLDLSRFGLESIPENIGQLSALQTLYLSHNQLTGLPECIGNLTALRTLWLHNNQLTSVPESLSQLTALRTLWIHNNHLTKLPERLGQLTSLRWFSLEHNQLTELPESLGRLTALERFDLHFNQLKNLPESFDRLTALQSLYLYNNQLTSLPENFGQLTALKTIWLHNNQLKSLPESFSRLTALQSLHLYNNQLTSLPENFGQLTALGSLELHNNQLESLPESFGRLTTLQSLNLYNNQLRSLPESFGQLIRLEELSLEYNQLTSLPENFGQLAALETLYIYNNSLTSLPESLLSLNKLKRVYLHENKELFPTTEALSSELGDASNVERLNGTKRILDFYINTRREKPRPLNEGKLILVGRGGVGKTSLVNQIVNGKFNSKEETTHGIRITPWKIHLREEEIRLNLWDFGGQEIMHATHQFFLTKRSLYLLVLSGREGNEDSDAEYWLKLIKSFGDESSVIVVLNKIKEVPFTLNKSGLQREYSFIREFIETDCSEPLGIMELRAAIERETDRLPDIRMPFPNSWFAIKERLPEIQRDFLTLEEFRAECVASGIEKADDQTLLAKILHILGIALNYEDDARLNHTHVLNPRWVTDGVYSVINSPLLAEREGRIGLKDLPQMLDPARYPQGLQCFLIDLMRKFEICLPFPETEDQYLIPQLLSKEEPPEVGAFESVNCLNFRYEYPVLPEGLLPQFIVRTHALSRETPRWRSGVILAFEGAVGIVRTSGLAVEIMVDGPILARRRLLSVIRSDFERIHLNFKGLNVMELVPLAQFPGKPIPYTTLLTWERRGREIYEFEDGDDIHKVNVRELLNGLDIQPTARKHDSHEGRGATMGAKKLFYCYSHKDEAFRDELETHLKLLQRQGVIETWHDRRILAGEEWKDKIDDNLNRADIILLLISADFIASDYCYDIEMKRAMERHEAGEAKVIPVILRKNNWHSAPFGKLQALPKDGQPINLWNDRDSAWADVATSIERVIKASLPAVSNSKPTAQSQTSGSKSKVSTTTDRDNSRKELLNTLSRILPSQLPLMFVHLNVPHHFLPGANAPQAEKVAALIQWAESPGGCGLGKISDALKEVFEGNIYPKRRKE